VNSGVAAQFCVSLGHLAATHKTTLLSWQIYQKIQLTEIEQKSLGGCETGLDDHNGDMIAAETDSPSQLVVTHGRVTRHAPKTCICIHV
jgi:hypothetical protein